MVWVHTFRKGVQTGEMRGFATGEIAQQYIDCMRISRDNSPVWIAYKEGGYDWEIVLFDNPEKDV